MSAEYQLQLPPDGRFTEWRPIEQPVTEPLVLSVFFRGEPTAKQQATFWAQFEIPQS